jgi:hypothetical protein
MSLDSETSMVEARGTRFGSQPAPIKINSQVLETPKSLFQLNKTNLGYMAERLIKQERRSSSSKNQGQVKR